MLVGVTAMLTQDSRLSILSVLVLFVVGGGLLLFGARRDAAAQAAQQRA
jgi:MFS-type transporter involved in bile tolerance (Atg22 family)